MYTIKITLLVFLLATSIASSATLKVPSNYSNIQTAINATVTGDTVLVAPGLYHCHFNYTGKDIVVISKSGPEFTILRIDTISGPLVEFNSGETGDAVLSGFTLSGTSYWSPQVQIRDAGATIKNNIFTDHSSYLSGGSNQLYIRDGLDIITIEDNLFIADTGTAKIVWISSSNQTLIINNTFVGYARGITNWSNNTVIRNNIFSGMEWAISVVTGPSMDHNLFWDNLEDVHSGSTSLSATLADPMFVDTTNENYQLMAGSPAINAGNENVAYYDLDGTIGDVGRHYFDLRIPTPYNLNLGVDKHHHVASLSPTFYWSQFGLNIEVHEIEIGIDNDWAIAETWNPGPIAGWDTSITYGGSTLTDGETYYYRVRLYDSAQIGPWQESLFRMNSEPTVPLLEFPIGPDSTSVFGVELYVNNSTDSENDDRTYDFEIYADLSMFNLIATVNGVIGTDSLTSSGKIAGLTVGETYYWRSRAYDSYEYSNWTMVESFYVRSPQSYHVPSEFPTIQAGMNHASELDTVLVADGIYSGAGNVDLDLRGINMTIKSVNGPLSSSIEVGNNDLDRHRIMTVSKGEDTTSVIEGFRLGNGLADGPLIQLERDNGLHIKNCIIESTDGSGIFGDWNSFLVIDNSSFLNCGFSGIYTYGNGRISNSIFARNKFFGLGMYHGVMVNVDGCSFILNGSSGFYIEPEPPKSTFSPAASQFDTAVVSNSLAAYNGSVGFDIFSWALTRIGTCNNSYGNGARDYPYAFVVGENFNISQNPVFCDTSINTFTISSHSACAPANNDCAILIGAGEIGCTDCCRYRGDYNHSGGSVPVDIADITAAVSFLFRNGNPAVCPEEGDVTGDGSVNIADLTYLIDYMFRQGAVPPPC